MSNTKHLRRASLLVVLGASTIAALSGCGGAKTNSGGTASAATPTVYGVNPATGEAGSGIEFPVTTTGTSGPVTTTTGGLVAALSSTAVPLEGTVPLGFATGGLQADGSAGQAVLASQASVTFAALIANGNVGNNAGAITGATLTSPEVPSFTQTLTFTGVGTGVLGAAGYTGPAFTLPFTTSGIHQLTASVTDEGAQKTTTTLGVVVVAPTDVALFLQSFDTGKPDPASTTKPPADLFNAIAPGDLVTIDGGQGTGVYPATGYNSATAGGASSPTTADPQGTVVLFTTPGTHTVVETDPTGKTVVNTSTFTLPATAAGTTIYAVPAPTATTTAAVSKPHLVRNAFKH